MTCKRLALPATVPPRAHEPMRYRCARIRLVESPPWGGYWRQRQRGEINRLFTEWHPATNENRHFYHTAKVGMEWWELDPKLLEYAENTREFFSAEFPGTAEEWERLWRRNGGLPSDS